ncbi:unknown protein [Seminavis robusta]|uniref:Uncharacterized protein n=1 Tax=Seminavis robusta TaxID=568900 RepID=A0A9N8EL89_9STRA|nr:unknown protein [Seminavis robusta]|eukprot:Sro1401_g269440.1 n/a (1054) ;mRNA; r:8937-12098
MEANSGGMAMQFAFAVTMSNQLIARAVDVHRGIPDWIESAFSKTDCLMAVGMDEESAMSETNRRHMFRLLKGTEQSEGPPYHPNTEQDNTNRAVYLAGLITINPATGRKASLAYVMRLAGFPESSCGPGKNYVRVSRRITALKKKQPTASKPPAAAKIPPATTNSKRPPAPSYASKRPVNEIQLEEDTYSAPNVLSPLSSASLSDRPPVARKPKARDAPLVHDEVCFEYYNTPPIFDYSETLPPPFLSPMSDSSSSCGSVANVSFKDAKHRPKNINSAISHLTTSQVHRRTTQAAQIERQTDRELDNIRKSMYKAGTVIYKSVTTKENTLHIFKSSEAVASALNHLIGVDMLSGRELAEGVRKGRVNQSPPRLGRKGDIPQDVFKAFCSAVFTLCAIEQANCQDRMNREQLKSSVGEVLNEMRQRNGLDSMNDSKFYSRIEKEISHLQDLEKADTRESLRVLWLTYQAQQKHYINWEQTAVELGFARQLLPTELTEDVGYIVWKEEALHRVLQFDEMNIALDGTDDSIGGRQSRIPTSKGMGNAGKAAEKSGASMTLMFGMSFANEALPPLFIFPTKSKDPSNYKHRVDFAASLPQLEAQYGFNRLRRHNVPFAMNPKGGMTKEMLEAFFRKCVLPLYPNAADREGQRLLIKIDSGPGRNNPDCLRKLRARGAHLHPGLPNGTEVGQECDQLFSLLKKLIYQNREKLWGSRYRLEGEKAALSMADVGMLVFGGSATMIDGTTVELVDAFAQATDAEHISAAARKCGYCPSTRVGLKSAKIRHEIVETEDGDINESADPYGCLLDELEQQNDDAVSFLEDNDYNLADNLRRHPKRVTSAQTKGRMSVVTVPNTRERQDAIQSCSTAGGWFQATNGGAPMTCDDALIAYARKDMLVRAEEMEKRKKSTNKRVTVDSGVKKIVDSKRSHKEWLKPELQTMIKWKQGLHPTAPYNDSVQKKKQELVTLWETKYQHLEVNNDDDGWTSDDSEELQRLRDGTIFDFDADVGLNNCFDNEDEFLSTSLLTIDKARRRKVLLGVFQSMDKDESDDIVAEIM